MTNTLVGLIQALIIAVFGLLDAFSIWNLTDVQRGSILALYGALAAVVIALNVAYGKPAEIRKAARAQGVSVPTI